MPRYEAEAKVREKAPLKLGIRAFSAAEMERETGVLKGSSLRLVPFDARSFGPLYEIANMPPGDVFERDWVVLEITAELDSSAILNAEIGQVELLSRSRAAENPNQPWASPWIDASPWKTWTPEPKELLAEQALAVSMGLWREAGTRGPSLWSMLDLTGLVLTGGLIDIHSRGSNPLLISESFPAKRPSPDEATAISTLLSLTQKERCGELRAGQTCKRRLLLQRKDPARINAVRAHIMYPFEGCTVEHWVTVPLIPARTLKEQLHARFGGASVPLTTLDAQETQMENSRRECKGDATACPPPKDCTTTTDCALWGKCERKGNTCVATTSFCEGLSSCEVIGACRAEDGVCSMPKGVDNACGRSCAFWGGCVKSGERCWAETEEHCASSRGCKLWGFCHLDAHTCVAASADDCAKSDACKERGFCSARERRCVAAKDEDCKAATICTELGACQAKGDICVTAK